MKLSSTFSFDRVFFGEKTEAHLLITAKAPKIKVTETRKPLNIVVALDVSSSMVGQPIEYVQKSVLKLIEHLTPEDRLGIITFNHLVNSECAPVFMTDENRSKYIQVANKIFASGSTNFSGALLEGLNWCKNLDTQTRLIILTDGQPTAGETNLSRILELARVNKTDSVSITAFGYGEHHDDVFLRSLSEIGKGNYTYIQTPDDALKAFARELGGLRSCYAQNVKFKVIPKDGVELVKVVSDVDVVDLDRGVQVTCADMYSEEVRHIVLKVNLPKQDKPLPRKVTLVDVNLEFISTEDGKVHQLGSKAQVSFVKKEDADKDPIRAVMEQVAIAEIADAQKAATERASAGDFAGAQIVLKGMTRNISYAPEEYNNHYVTLTTCYADSNSFESTAKYRSASSQSFRSNKYSGGDFVTGSVNSAQEELVKNFTTDAVELKGGTATSSTVVVPSEVDSAKKSLAKRRQDSW